MSVAISYIWHFEKNIIGRVCTVIVNIGLARVLRAPSPSPEKNK